MRLRDASWRDKLVAAGMAAAVLLPEVAVAVLGALGLHLLIRWIWE